MKRNTIRCAVLSWRESRSIPDAGFRSENPTVRSQHRMHQGGLPAFAKQLGPVADYCRPPLRFFWRSEIQVLTVNVVSRGYDAMRYTPIRPTKIRAVRADFFRLSESACPLVGRCKPHF